MTDSRRLAWVLLAGLLIIGTGIGLKDPWPSDEPRFSLVAREMVESGQWFFPTRGGELYPDKPPLFMWVQATVLSLTGSQKVAHLLPSLAFGLITLLLVFDAGRRLYDGRRATLACLLLLAAPQFVLESRAGQIDAMVMAWIALGVYGFLRHLLLGPSVRWLLIGFAACGLGVITKGVGFLPVLIFIPALMLWRRLQPPPTPGTVARRAMAGTMVMLGAISLWFVPMLILVVASGDSAFEAYRDNILLKQTAERYASPDHHFKPAWYFIGEVIPSLWLPVFLLLPWLLPAWWHRLRQRDPATILLLGWAALVVLFFSISPAKRGVYVLPALPWVCLAAAPHLPEIFRKRLVRRLAWICVVIAGLILLGGAGWLHWLQPQRVAEAFERYGMDLRPALLIAGAATVLVAIAGYRHGPAAFLGMMVCLWLTIGLWIYPRLDKTKSGRGLMLVVEQHLAPETPLGLVHWREQTLLQAQRPTVNFGFLVPVEDQARAAADWLRQNPNGKVLLQEPDLEYCFKRGKSDYLGVAHRRKWHLVGIDNLSC